MHPQLVTLRFSHAIGAFILMALCAVLTARAADPADLKRFLGVAEWTGVLSTKAESSGEHEVAGGGRVTYGSSVIVHGKFRLNPHRDDRNVDPLSWRGKGEALVRVSGKRKTLYEEESITETWVGDYVDTFEVEISNIDLEGGTYQMAVILAPWQDQPHEGKAIEHIAVHRTRYGTYTDVSMDPGHPWAADGGAGFGRQSALPKTRMIISGTMSNDNDDFLSQNGSHWHTQWEIRPVGPEYEEPLKAIAGGPYAVERGKFVQLDAFQSTGRIRNYHWKFEPADAASSIPFRAGTTKDGRRVPLAVLSPVKATLTVSDGEKQDSDSVVIAMTPRDYRTPFLHREEEKKHPRSVPPRLVRGYDTRCPGGENVCALDDYDAADSIHILHPAAVADLWDTRGYTLAQINDPNGPFDGCWYPDTYLLRVEREVLINKYILPGGPPPVRTAKRFYDANKALGHDIDGYLAAVRRHEWLHSDLIQQALLRSDPGPVIETMALPDRQTLKEQIDAAISSSEKIIDHASEDPLPWVGFKGPIAFPDDATDEYHSMDVEI